MVQYYNQEEGVDFEETFAPTARLKFIRMLLFVIKRFTYYQMDVKGTSKWFHSRRNICWTTSPFNNHKNLASVFKLRKALYGLK